MQPANVNDLHANPSNPRIASTKQIEDLKKSLDKFGDISGVTWNVRLNRLVTGHQRVSSFKDLGWQNNIEYVQRHETPTEKGTVAVGYINANGERFAYREVDWTQALDNAANIAANKIQAGWDKDALAEVTYQIYQEDPSLLENIGHTQKEINTLLAATGMEIPGMEDQKKKDDEPDDGKEDLSFRLTREQKDLILTAIENVRITKDIPSQDPSSMNGSALYYMSQAYLSTAAPLPPQPSTPLTDIPQE